MELRLSPDLRPGRRRSPNPGALDQAERTVAGQHRPRGRALRGAGLAARRPAPSDPRTIASHRAKLALRLARDTYLAPVQNQPHREPRPILGWQDLLHVDFNLCRIRMLREPQPIRQPPHMRIDHEPRLAEDLPQNHVSGLAPDPRNFHELFHLGWNLAAVVLGDLPCGADQRARFLAKESRLDD